MPRQDEEYRGQRDDDDNYSRSRSSSRSNGDRGDGRGSSRGNDRERDEQGRFASDDDDRGGRGSSRGGEPDRDERGRFMSDDGRVAFTTSDALVPGDTNNILDVYEFVDGRPHLITSGTGERDRFPGGLLIYPTHYVGLEAVSADGVVHVVVSRQGDSWAAESVR